MRLTENQLRETIRRILLESVENDEFSPESIEKFTEKEFEYSGEVIGRMELYPDRVLICKMDGKQVQYGLTTPSGGTWWFYKDWLETRANDKKFFWEELGKVLPRVNRQR